jgi:hypothetical protein
LITTATANTLYLDPTAYGTPASQGSLELIKVYPGRSFRFCFTNQQMAQAVVDFLWTQPDLRPQGDPQLALAAVPLAAADPWAALASLVAREDEAPPRANALEWDDDPYTIDMTRQFHHAFHEPGRPQVRVGHSIGIPFSVGDFYRANDWEAEAVDKQLLPDARANPLGRQVLVLPADVQGRRVLRALTGAMPLVGRRLVAVSGTSISLNSVYRDADIGWNVRAVPVPLVFFTHQNPVDWQEADGDHRSGKNRPSATDDVLLYSEIVRCLAEEAYGVAAGSKPSASGSAVPLLVGDADVLMKRLRERQPALFDQDGDRLGGQGEYVLVLRPEIANPGGGTQISSVARLEVWTRGTVPGRERDPRQPNRSVAPETGSPVTPPWKLIKSLVFDDGRSSPPGTP